MAAPFYDVSFCNYHYFGLLCSSVVVEKSNQNKFAVSLQVVLPEA